MNRQQHKGIEMKFIIFAVNKNTGLMDCFFTKAFEEIKEAMNYGNGIVKNNSDLTFDMAVGT